MPTYNVQLMGSKVTTVYHTFTIDAADAGEAEDKAFKQAETLHPRDAEEAGKGEIDWEEVMSTEEA